YRTGQSARPSIREDFQPSDPQRRGARPTRDGADDPPPEDCLVLLEDRCPASITPERFWANPKRLAANRAGAEAPGGVRPGPPWLGGILRCGRWGQRMLVT